MKIIQCQKTYIWITAEAMLILTQAFSFKSDKFSHYLHLKNAQHLLHYLVLKTYFVFYFLKLSVNFIN